MQVISYVSDSLIPAGCQPVDIPKVISNAQKRNAQLEITGVLFVENNHFFQTIEGPRDTLNQPYKEIADDPRYANLQKLVDAPISHRAFEGWNMDGFQIDNPELVNPKVLSGMRSMYYDAFGGDAAGMIDFVKHTVEELDTYKIKADLQLPQNPVS